MAEDTQDTQQDEAPEVGAPIPNDELEHTDGGATTRDAMDAGAPMAQGDGTEPVGPEDALGLAPTRGDYSDRTLTGPSMYTHTLTEDERSAKLDELVGSKRSKESEDEYAARRLAANADVPRFELRPQGVAPQAAE